METKIRIPRFMMLLIDRRSVFCSIVEEKKIVLEEEIGTLQIVPKDVKSSEYSDRAADDKATRHTDALLEKHIEEAGESISKFVEKHNISVIALASHAELFEKVKNHLPQSVSSKIVTQFPADFKVPHVEIALKARKQLASALVAQGK